MRREESRRNTLQEGIARAKSLLARSLPWAPGYPIELQGTRIAWQAVDWERPGGYREYLLDRASLRLAEIAVAQLRRDFRRGLGHLVEDLDRWFDRMAALLVALKHAVHDQKALTAVGVVLPRSVNRRWLSTWHRLRRQNPDGHFLWDAVFFLELSKHSEPSQDLLEWIEAQGGLLSQVPGGARQRLEIQLTLCRLRQEGSTDFLARIVPTLASARFHAVDCGGFDAWVQTVMQQAETPAGERVQSAPAVCRLLAELGSAKPTIRRRAIPWITELLPDHVGTPPVPDRFLAMLKKYQQHPTAKTRRLIESSEPFLVDRNLDYFLRNIVSLAAGQPLLWKCRTFFRKLDVSRQPYLRVFRFVGWYRFAKTYQKVPKYCWVLEELGRLITRRGIHPDLVTQWTTIPCAVNDWVHLMVTFDGNKAACTRAMELMERVLYDRIIGDCKEVLPQLLLFAGATDDLEAATAVMANLGSEFLRRNECQDSGIFDEAALKAVFALRLEPETARPVLIKLGKNDALCRGLVALAQSAPDDTCRQALTYALQHRDTSALESAIRYVTQLRQAGGTIPHVPHVPYDAAWVAAYPKALQAALSMLAQFCPGGASAARLILAKDFPDRESLQHEAETLARLLDVGPEKITAERRSHLQRRLATLRAQRDRTASTTPERLRNLRRKVEDRAGLEWSLRLAELCREAATANLQQILDVEEIHPELLQPPLTGVVQGILSMQGKSRDLGLRLLRQICLDATHDFRDDPENRSFLASLDGRGIATAPWLDPQHVATRTTVGGEPYHVAFTRDIRDVLLMGFHFCTCVAPTGHNFFAVLANAVDVNKRVLYGRTADGRIIGRCLVALNERGEILTYERYVHEVKDDFGTAVSDFVRELAAQMRTQLADQGTVPRLVATRWYDDGAMAIGPAHDLDEPDSPIRQLLRDATDNDLFPRLEAMLGSWDAVSGLAGALSGLADFRRRAPWNAQFLQRLGHGPSIDWELRIRLVAQARRALSAATRNEQLGAFPRKVLLRRLTASYCDGCHGFHTERHHIGTLTGVVRVVTDLDPTLALRLLRGTRSRGVRSDAEETVPARVRVLAAIHQRLGRSALAKRLSAQLKPTPPAHK